MSRIYRRLQALPIYTYFVTVEYLDILTIRKIRQIDNLPKRAKLALWQTINATLEVSQLKTNRKKLFNRGVL